MRDVLVGGTFCSKPIKSRNMDDRHNGPEARHINGAATPYEERRKINRTWTERSTMNEPMAGPNSSTCQLGTMATAAVKVIEMQPC